MKNLIVSHNYFALISGYVNKMERQYLNLDSLADKAGVGKYSPELKSVYVIEDVKYLIKKIAQISDDMSFGLTLGENIHPSDYGLVGYALMNCHDLNMALSLSAKYKPIMNQAFESCFIKGKTNSSYQINAKFDEDYLAVLIELDFASGIQLAKLLVDKQDLKRLILQQVNFQHGPLSADSHYQRVFNCPVKFYQEKNEIIITNRVLALPVRSANSAILDMLIRKIEQSVASYALGQTFSHKVINYVSKHKQEIPNVTQAASYFNISASTLKKHLMLEERNYSEICDSVRKSVAIEMLAQPKTQIKAVYSFLNFSSSSAFNRAFKRWTSMTPTEYRQKAVQGEQLLLNQYI